jgi:hypothetical protein
MCEALVPIERTSVAPLVKQPVRALVHTTEAFCVPSDVWNIYCITNMTGLTI